MTRVVGVDLASLAPGTAVCVLDDLAIERLGVGRVDGVGVLDDAALLGLCEGADKVAIDAPFGWPRPFVAAVAAHAAGRGWPVAPDAVADRRLLESRATDRHVRHATKLGERTAKTPLSVSTDKIAMPAMRCAGLLAALGVTDRSGAGRAVEVYPDAALREWDLHGGGYKGREKGAQRAAIVDRLGTVVDVGAHRDACIVSDDALDALLCALVGRAVALGLTAAAPDDLADLAREEGWIHLPRRGTFAALRAASRG